MEIFPVGNTISEVATSKDYTESSAVATILFTAFSESRKLLLSTRRTAPSAWER